MTERQWLHPSAFILQKSFDPFVEFIRKYKIRKCISLQKVLKDILQYEIYSPLYLNKTAQQNS